MYYLDVVALAREEAFGAPAAKERLLTYSTTSIWSTIRSPPCGLRGPVPVSVASAQIQRTQIDIRLVDAGRPQAAGGLSSARPGVRRVVGAGGRRRRGGAPKEQRRRG